LQPIIELVCGLVDIKRFCVTLKSANVNKLVLYFAHAVHVADPRSVIGGSSKARDNPTLYTLFANLLYIYIAETANKNRVELR
jgi:hypothetical protein